MDRYGCTSPPLTFIPFLSHFPSFMASYHRNESIARLSNTVITSITVHDVHENETSEDEAESRDGSRELGRAESIAPRPDKR